MYHWWHDIDITGTTVQWSHRHHLDWLSPGSCPKLATASRAPCSMLGCSDVPGQKIHKEICSSFSCYIMQNRTMKTCKLQILRLIFRNIIWRHLSDNDGCCCGWCCSPISAPSCVLSPLFLAQIIWNKQEMYIHYYFRDRDTENLHKY